ncbi:MAG: FAD-dependent oxidoreductase [Bdellovibrionaceae bacterium]|nr:FAD-dependent oxidoreductase [Pseudobdellovibrionaceae bacterium]
MSVIIVGNGVLGLTTAYRLAQLAPDLPVKIIGPDHHKGCASLAAAAMLNSFCEVEPRTLNHPILKERFLLNREAVPLWPEFLKNLINESGVQIYHGFGTYLIENHAADELDDLNFNAVIDALKKFEEPFSYVESSQIPNYAPSSRLRAANAILIPNEGFLNPVDLFAALKARLQQFQNVEFVNQTVDHVIANGSSVRSVVLNNGKQVDGTMFFLAPGATFSKIVEKSNLPISFPKVFYGVGCSILLKTGDFTHSYCVRTPNRGLACGVYSAPFDREHTIIGASNFISPVPEDAVRLTSVHTLIEAAMEQINTVFYRSQLVKVNVGWRPTSEDTLPILGQTQLDNLVVATGTKRDGLHCSPLLSTLFARLLLKESIDYDLSLYSPHRKRVSLFTRDEAIEDSVNHTINAAYQHGFVPAHNRMIEELRSYYQKEFSDLHDKVGAIEWGIPPELVNMYKFGHLS